jgi:hypothetical protein
MVNKGDDDVLPIYMNPFAGTLMTREVKSETGNFKREERELYDMVSSFML